MDTLAALRDAAPEDELFLILGGDQAGRAAGAGASRSACSSWRRWPACRAASSPRERDPAELAGLGGADRIRFFDMPRVDISSTLVRERASRGEPIRYLVPDSVVDYIVSNGPLRGEALTAEPTTVDSAALAQRIAEIAADRKAIDLRVLDLRGIVSYTDFFVICTGNTERQTKAIHDALHKELKDVEGLLPRRSEGDREARWILLDYLDCVVHIFTPDAREYYRLDQLWGEAPQVAVG